MFVNTSMHGVSHPFVTKALGSYGIVVNPVSEQMLPDPGFPTVPFPNPEEKGVHSLDMCFRRGNKLTRYARGAGV